MMLLQTSSDLARHYAAIPLVLPTQFPVMFGGERVAFGMALFSQMLIANTSLAAIIELVRLFHSYGEKWRTPAQMHRLALLGVLVAMVMLTLPGAAFNLLWHEVPTDTLRRVQQVRILCQSLSFVPFLAGMTMLALARHAITFQLIRLPLPIDLWSNRAQMWQSARIGVLCLIIAVGVAVFK